MKIEFKEILNKNEWQNFVTSQKFFTFLQSWQWGEFQEMDGEKIFRIGGYVDGELVMTALVIKVKAKRGTFLLVPHGPVVKGARGKGQGARNFIFGEFTNYLVNLSKKEKVDFIRLNSVLTNTKENGGMLKSLGYKFAPMHVHSETTWLLDLEKSEDQLMSDMRKTTRYIINRGQKEGVEIVQDNSAEAIQKFVKLHQFHSKHNKHQYAGFSAKYISNLFKVFNKDEISLKFANYDGVTEAASIIIFYGKSAIYYLAATDTKHPKFSPSYLLQWQSILEAKVKGCTSYNFWGVSPDDNPKHPIAGVSRFKRGFGGYQLDLLHAYDYSITKKYYLNYIIETIRRKKRGYYYIIPN